MTRKTKISRRQALARLGLGVSVAYVSPAVIGLSQARASGASPASKASAPSKATAPSAASRPSKASAPSAASSPSGPDVTGADAGTSAQASGPSDIRNECRVTGGGGQMTISKQEYRQVQAAIRQGEARPLGEIVKIARQRYPGQPIRVGFSMGSGEPRYHVQIVTGSGAIVAVTVSARSGSILKARRC